MADQPSDHLKQVNSSGLLYQLRIGHEIKTTAGQHGWELKCSEYRWVDPATDDEEFIDLILKSGQVEIVAECKRVSGGTWIFPVQEPAQETERMRLLWAVKIDDSRGVSSWDDVGFLPRSFESSLCIMPGSNERDKPMLERIASKLVRSAEALSQDEYALLRSSTLGRQLRIYLPVIITNAQIKICRFDPKKIDLASGLLSDGAFEDVPFVRFRKTLSTNIKPYAASDVKPLIDVSDLNERIERSVLIVNGSEIGRVLAKRDTRLFAHDEFVGLPWTDALHGLLRDE